jgi:hypothetical protein
MRAQLGVSPLRFQGSPFFIKQLGERFEPSPGQTLSRGYFVAFGTETQIDANAYGVTCRLSGGKNRPQARLQAQIECAGGYQAAFHMGSILPSESPHDDPWRDSGASFGFTNPSIPSL